MFQLWPLDWRLQGWFHYQCCLNKVNSRQRQVKALLLSLDTIQATFSTHHRDISKIQYMYYKELEIRMIPSNFKAPDIHDELLKSEVRQGVNLICLSRWTKFKASLLFLCINYFHYCYNICYWIKCLRYNLYLFCILHQGRKYHQHCWAHNQSFWKNY